MRETETGRGQGEGEAPERWGGARDLGAGL